MGVSRRTVIFGATAVAAGAAGGLYEKGKGKKEEAVKPEPKPKSTKGKNK